MAIKDWPKIKMEDFAIATTRWIGSVGSIMLHTILFIVSFAVVSGGFVEFDKMLLILTTIVSLEAIYLAIFIQMSLNYTNQELAEVEQDIDEIQEDIDELQEDVEEISEDDHTDEERRKEQRVTLEEIRQGLRKLTQDIERIQDRS